MTATNHGCRFSWCENPSDKWEAHRLEHFQTADYIPASANSLGRLGEVWKVGAAVRFNEDVDPAQHIIVHALGPNGEDIGIEFRTDEAVLFHNALGAAIDRAVEGTRLSPAEITRFYAPEVDGRAGR
jgi:hypothetical protein